MKTVESSHMGKSGWHFPNHIWLFRYMVIWLYGYTGYMILGLVCVWRSGCVAIWLYRFVKIVPGYMGYSCMSCSRK